MIDKNVLEKMFVLAGIDKTKLHETLRELGQPKKCKEEWNLQCPTIGYCYAVSEAVSYFLKKRKVPHKTFRLARGDGIPHWFIRLGEEGDGDIIDLTADQTDEDFKYGDAKPKAPQINKHMKKYGMSKRAEEIARKMQLL